MLDEKRIKEAEINVKSYLTDGLLKRTVPDKEIMHILRKNALESLQVAETVRDISELWMIVCSYYSMFYYANAILLSHGYKTAEKMVHKVTSDAMIVFIRGKLRDSLLLEYEETKEEAMNLAGLRANILVESLDLERTKRNIIQYRTLDMEKHSKAITSLNRAKEFTREIEKLLL